MNQLMVAAPPITIDDTEWQEVVAYDLNGIKRILSAKEPPQEPVLVITPCEHHGEHSPASSKSLSKTTSPSSGVWRLTILDFLLYDDHEPWSSGDAEIYAKVLNNSHWYSTNCYDINHEGSYYDCDIPLDPEWDFQPSGTRYFEIWEEDDTSADDLVEKYWHWPNPSDPKRRDVDLNQQRWSYGDNDDEDVQMRVIYY
jgi:hypothetical protein